jgi:hypothetical protein
LINISKEFQQWNSFFIVGASLLPKDRIGGTGLLPLAFLPAQNATAQKELKQMAQSLAQSLVAQL